MKLQRINHYWFALEGGSIQEMGTLESCLKEIYRPLRQERFDQHDCHTSPDDGCKTCEEFFS